MKGYEAVHRLAGWRELTERGLVSVSGPDRISFLHNMISNDVETLPVDGARRGTLLTATGKMVAEFSYTLRDDAIWVSLTRESAGIFISALDGYIIMDDVTLEDLSGQFSTFSVQGPHSPAVIAELLGGSPPEGGTFRDVDFEGRRVRCVSRPEVSGNGFEIITASSAAPGFLAALEKLSTTGIEAVDVEAWDLLRLEQGRPLFGVDTDASSNPLEAGLLDAISFDKGCYVGQEVIARATHIGGVPRRIVRILLESEVARGSDLFEAGRERPVGKVTSCRWSPANDAWIGLARIRSRSAEAGLPLESRGANRPPVPVHVVEHFPAEVEKPVV